MIIEIHMRSKEEWKCREPQEKNGQIRTEIERTL